ncbi:hypothetical protein FHL15_009019 [Xylaria flabelliformis]|uniref:Uncharacterized protein n=1 Tax=Xylaria flabelliformis TaxID=2512241 RepID=A0A553HQ86_9PEZI|nr:hypothetical protein FHL15_009019 [Xylaria flabelliformis]
MASVGKITPSLLSASNEVNVALATFNLDFSLMKIEAPKEFHGVRDALSVPRRSNAEEGQAHITARKLGALFESIIPPIPHLIEAYGKRVSAISLSLGMTNSEKSEYGIFAKQAGFDGTSIWAAATSGKGAIAIHLLACMLARIWSAPEAISIWVELVERRKQQVATYFQDRNVSDLATLTAARQDISRQQLSTWDASARSWLRTADKSKQLQQTQMMIILKNIRIQVNTNKDTFDSVVEALTTALTAMDRLVQGIPQRITNGATLLAISSWHIYPDMCVIASEVKSISQGDDLMVGATLTLSAVNLDECKAGVFWSLPLSRMRYYARPKIVERQVASDTSHVSLAEFRIVCLGAIIGPWLDTGSDEDCCCRLIITIFDKVKDCKDRVTWLELLSKAADDYIFSQSTLRQRYRQLLGLGSRRSGQFLNYSRTDSVPFFGLQLFDNLSTLFHDEESAISFLRQVASSLDKNQENLIIRYFRISQDLISKFEYCSAIPSRQRVEKSTFDSVSRSSQNHHRWVIGETIKYQKLKNRKPRVQYHPATLSDQNIKSSSLEIRRQCGGEEEEEEDDMDSGPFGSWEDIDMNCDTAESNCNDKESDCEDVKLDYDTTESNCDSKESDCGNCDACTTFPGHRISSYACNATCSSCYNDEVRRVMAKCHEDWSFITQQHVRDDGHKFTLKKPGEIPISYELVLGNSLTSGLFRAENDSNLHARDPQHNKYITIEQIEGVIQSSTPGSGALISILQKWSTPGSSCETALLALSQIDQLYETLDGARINLGVLQSQLHLAKWVEWGNGGLKNLTSAFVCIAMMETGEFDIDPSSLENVIALSSGDSIFVASALLRDPLLPAESSKLVKRVLGSVGRSELVFMVPTAEPILKEADPGSWRLINHHAFDGQFLNAFTGTSLHLSFTDYELPLDVGSKGLRDKQAIILESVISLNDGGTHYGDIDIMTAMNALQQGWFRKCNHIYQSAVGRCDYDLGLDGCNMATSGRVQDQKGFKDILTSLDCWEEVFDFPRKGAGIFRAAGNWEARLAAVAVGGQLKRRVLVLPPNGCMLCLNRYRGCTKFDIIIA